jgi:tetratricopeptide (TPR) repeat protein
MMAAAIVFACFVPSAQAETARRFADSPCLMQDGTAAVQACELLARDISHDIDAARTLGDELERSGRYDAAAAAYQIALTVHPNNRNLLQRLIRARGQARSLRQLAAPAEVVPQTRSEPAPTPAIAGKPKTLAQAAPAPTEIAPTTAMPPARESTAAASQLPAGGQNLALVIGNEQYADFTRLRTPASDAHAIATVLRRDYGFDVTELTNATRYQIVSALSRLRRAATENDNVLIYYAGHGYLDDTTSRGYWLPVDAEHDNIANWLSTNDVTDVLAGLQARHALVLADSCFSGILLRSDPTVALDERQSLLRKLSTRRSRSIMTSGGLEPVSDGGSGRHSVFAAALLDALQENRQSLEAARLFMQIRERVAAGAAQTPQYGAMRNAGHDGGDFIFARAR